MNFQLRSKLIHQRAMARRTRRRRRVHHQRNVHSRPRELEDLQRADDYRRLEHIRSAGRRHLSARQHRVVAPRKSLPERTAWSKINDRRLDIVVTY